MYRRDAGISAVKKKLQDACTDRKGSPDSESFEVVFEKTSDNPNVPTPYYVGGKMKCDLPGGGHPIWSPHEAACRLSLQGMEPRAAQLQARDGWAAWEAADQRSALR